MAKASSGYRAHKSTAVMTVPVMPWRRLLSLYRGQP